MSRPETARRGWSGSRLVLASLVVGGAGVSPLLLDIAFGPADGNPIGLGLLAVVAMPAASVGVVAGLLSMLLQRLVSRGWLPLQSRGPAGSSGWPS